MTVEIVEKELSYKIVQAAYEVFNALGPGFMEKIYREAMVLVLRKKVTRWNGKSLCQYSSGECKSALTF